MKKHHRTLILITILMISGFFFISGLLTFFALDSYEQTEKNHIEENIAGFEDLLNSSSHDLLRIGRDYATWIEMAEYVNGNNPEFPKKYLNADNLINLNLQSVAIYNSDGNLVQELGINPITGEVDDTNPQISGYLSGSSLEVNDSINNEGRTWIFGTNDSAGILASIPIVYQYRNQSPVGTLMVSRLFTDKYIDDLSGVIRSPLKVNVSQQGSMIPDIVNKTWEQKRNTSFEILSEDKISGIITYQDPVTGSSIIFVTIYPRELYLQGIKTLSAFSAVIILIIGVCTALILITISSYLHETEAVQKRLLNKEQEIQSLNLQQKFSHKIEEINRAFLSFGDEPDENIRIVLTTCGRILNISQAGYIREESGKENIISWSEETSLKPQIRISPLEEGALLKIREYKNEFGDDSKPDTDKVISESDRIVIARILSLPERGWVYLIKKTPSPLTGFEKNLVGLILSAIRVEESRRRSHLAIYTRDNVLKTVNYFAASLILSFSDETIENLLDRLGKTLDVSRIDIYTHAINRQGDSLITLIGEWTANGDEPSRIGSVETTSFPWKETVFSRWADSLQRMQPLIGLISEFPACEQKILQNLHLKSLIVMPIFSEDRFFGFMSLGEKHYDRIWKKEEIETLQIVVNILGAVFARKQAEGVIKDLFSDLQARHHDLEEVTRELSVLNQELDSRVRERTSDIERLMAQKSQFINQIAHDLRTPLTPLVAMIPMLKVTIQDPDLLEFIETMDKCVDYIEQTCEHILELAHLNNLHSLDDFEYFNLKDLVNKSADMMNFMAQEYEVTIENHIEPELNIRLSKIFSTTIFTNLINNSIKFNVQGGKIIISASEKKETIQISITDTGIGIRPDVLPHIWDEFYQSDSSRRDPLSKGLGLPIVRQIVALHGGTITAHSAGTGTGTTFVIILPSGDHPAL